MRSWSKTNWRYGLDSTFAARTGLRFQALSWVCHNQITIIELVHPAAREEPDQRLGVCGASYASEPSGRSRLLAVNPTVEAGERWIATPIRDCSKLKSYWLDSAWLVSGSTLILDPSAPRRGFGLLDPKYVDVAIVRLRAADAVTLWFRRYDSRRDQFRPSRLGSTLMCTCCSTNSLDSRVR